MIKTANKEKIRDIDDIFPNINNDIEHALTFYAEPKKSMPSVIIMTEGHEICSKDKRPIGPNKFNYYIMHYVFHGSGYIEYFNSQHEKIKVKVNKKEVFLISPKMEYTYYPDHNDPWEYSWISFFSESDSNLFSSLTSFDQCVIKLKHFKSVEKVFAKISKIPEYKYGKNSAAIAIFYEAISEIMENSTIRFKPDNDKNHIKECISYINENYTNADLTLKEIAQHLYLNEKYLSRIFTACMGVSVFEYVNSLRLKLASFKLTTTADSVATISSMIGYSDPLYFSKKFKQYIGVSPQNYRKFMKKKK